MVVRNMVIDCFSMHTHHLLYGVLTQYLSPGPCLDVVDWWSSSRPVVADAIARVPFALFISVSCSGSALEVLEVMSREFISLDSKFDGSPVPRELTPVQYGYPTDTP